MARDPRTFPVGGRLKGEEIWQTGPMERGVFVPRLMLETPAAPLSQSTDVIAARRTERQRVDTRQSLHQVPKFEVAAQHLVDLGLEVAKGSRKADKKLLPQGKPGIFQQRNGIGLTTAYFVDDSVRQRAIEDLSDQYVFVPDFDLSMPTPIRLDDDQDVTSDPPDEEDLQDWQEQCGVAKAHGDGNRGRGVVVGALDTGVDADHFEFRQRGREISFAYVPLHPDNGLRRVRGFDPDGHGTHVSGTLYANRFGIVPECRFLMGSVIESETIRTSFIRVVEGINWLLEATASPELRDRPAVVNLSLGFPPAPPLGMSADQYKILEAALSFSIRQLVAADILVVAAIGNDGAGRFRLPAIYNDVLSVGAVDYQLQVPAFSGSAADAVERKPDLVSFGVNVHSTYERSIKGRSRYATLSGTSMAAPHVTGLAALYWALDPGMDADGIAEKLIDCAQPIPNAEPARVGAGLACYR